VWTATYNRRQLSFIDSEITGITFFADIMHECARRSTFNIRLIEGVEYDSYILPRLRLFYVTKICISHFILFCLLVFIHFNVYM